MSQEIENCYLGVRWFKRLWPEGWDLVEERLCQAPEWIEPSEVYEQGVMEFSQTDDALVLSVPVWHPTPDRTDGPVEEVKLKIPLQEIPGA